MSFVIIRNNGFLKLKDKNNFLSVKMNSGSWKIQFTGDQFVSIAKSTAKQIKEKIETVDQNELLNQIVSFWSALKEKSKIPVWGSAIFYKCSRCGIIHEYSIETMLMEYPNGDFAKKTDCGFCGTKNTYKLIKGEMTMTKKEQIQKNLAKFFTTNNNAAQTDIFSKFAELGSGRTIGRVLADMAKTGVLVKEKKDNKIFWELKNKPAKKKDKKTSKKKGVRKPSEMKTFIIKLVKTGKWTRPQIIKKFMKKFPDSSTKTINSRLSDGGNPRWNPFKKEGLIVKDADGKLSFKKD